MDIDGFILDTLEIDKEKYGRIFAFVDFGNVDKWYIKDRGTFQGKLLKEG